MYNIFLFFFLKNYFFLFYVNSLQNKNFSFYKYFSNLSKDDYAKGLKLWYSKKTNKSLNLDNPKTYTEKIQWIKLYDIDYLKAYLTDKYLVREWIKKKIGEKYLIPLLGFWDQFKDIDFNNLPNKFVLKCNHGSNMNIIVLDKNKFNISEAKKKMDYWMKINYAFFYGLELQYKNIKKKIIAEEYIENNNNNINDYKIWCFDGKIEVIMVITERNKIKKYAFYDKNWNLLPFYYSNFQEKKIDRPKNLNELIKISEILSKGFRHVRTDFYILNNGTIKFGEMTFTPNSGIVNFSKEEYNEYFGNKIHIPNKKNNSNNINIIKNKENNDL